MIVRNGWSLIALTPFIEPSLPGPAHHDSRSPSHLGRHDETAAVTIRGAVRRHCAAAVRQGWGTIAMAMGLRQLLMRGPAVLVAV